MLFGLLIERFSFISLQNYIFLSCIVKIIYNSILNEIIIYNSYYEIDYLCYQYIANIDSIY